MQKIFLLLGSIIGALSVMIGAFGAHALKKLLSTNGNSDVFETAVKYQFYHAFALLITGMVMFNLKHKLFDYAGWSFIAGILVFSGSLYILSITNIKWLGAITPIGGLFMIIGWFLLTLALFKSL